MSWVFFDRLLVVTVKSGVLELACFRLVPGPSGSADTPASYWWDALEAFMREN
jgi:hypothetical protein